MRRITFVVYPGCSAIALAALSVFETANMFEKRGLFLSLCFGDRWRGQHFAESAARDRTVQQQARQHAHHRRRRNLAGAASSCHDQVCPRGGARASACNGDLHGSVCTSGSGPSRRAPRDHALALCARAAEAGAGGEPRADHARRRRLPRSARRVRWAVGDPGRVRRRLH